MLRIYFMIKGQYLKTAMEYTFNFWMMVIAGIVMRTLMMGVAFVLFSNVPDIAGWSLGEVYLIMAFMFISEGLCNLFFDGIWSLPSLVFNGQFDVFLSRPVSPLYQVLSYDIGLQGIGVLTLGVISLVLSIQYLGWLNISSLLLCTIFIICGTVLRLSVYIISSCYVFGSNTGGNTNFPYMIYSIGEYAKYPCNIYPIWMQLILLFIIPFAFIGYIPAIILRGEHVLELTILLAGVSAVFLALARWVFYKGIKKYESIGM
jgi:ABC-2 type transport system permease protein